MALGVALGVGVVMSVALGVGVIVGVALGVSVVGVVWLWVWGLLWVKVGMWRLWCGSGCGRCWGYGSGCER